MYQDKKICVVVPAHNEESQIGRVLDTMPSFVDKVVVVNDGSTDNTASVAGESGKKLGDRFVILENEKNQGVGAAISTGYRWARDNQMDVAVVMAGDAQMDPSDLSALIDPVVAGAADYSKGNRLFTGYAFQIIPKIRYLGNSALSMMTKIASGYWHVADSQSGYTAASLKVLQALDLDTIYKRFGMPNDMLVKLNIYNFRVKDVPVTPIYNVGEKSELKIYRVIFPMFFLLVRLFFWRMKEKYVIRDFHPLIFFYFLSFVLFVVGFGLFGRLLALWIQVGLIPKINALAFMFALTVAFQSLFFAMWFDMEANKHLR